MSFFATIAVLQTGRNFGGLVVRMRCAMSCHGSFSRARGEDLARLSSTTTVNARDRIGTGPGSIKPGYWLQTT
jgi:hypothetical protein